MKLFHKIFICFVVLFGVAFQVAGYLLINFSYEKVIEQEKRFAAQEFQHNKYIMLSVLYSDSRRIADHKIDFNRYAENFSVPVAIYGTDESCIYSNLSVPFESANLAEIKDRYAAYQINRTATESYILVCGLVSQNETEVYLVTECDISEVVNSQNSMIAYFQKIYLSMICFGLPVILLLSSLLVHSINKVSKAAKRIAEGRYTERIEASSKDEIGELATNFNHMAENIEENIVELSNQAQQKEDFAANFAHELKTPLTSVIGYADMLYQKDLPRDQVKSAAEYILSEGMRLETLSLKLMDLFMMDKQFFSLEEIFVREIFQNLKQGIEPICENCGVQFHSVIAIFIVTLLIFNQIILYPVNHWFANFMPVRMTDGTRFFVENELYQIGGASISCMSWSIVVSLLLSMGFLVAGLIALHVHKKGIVRVG